MRHMNIPSPQELRQAREAENAVHIESAITSIVAAMKAGNLNPYVEVPHAAQDAVRRRFAEAGWTISFHSDQRDGSWVTLVARS